MAFALDIATCLFNKNFGFHNFIEFSWLVNIQPLKSVGIRAHNTDYLQKITVLVLGIQLTSLAEVLTGHEEVLMVHAQDAFTKMFVVSVCRVQLVHAFQHFDID